MAVTQAALLAPRSGCWLPHPAASSTALHGEWRLLVSIQRLVLGDSKTPALPALLSHESSLCDSRLVKGRWRMLRSPEDRAPSQGEGRCKGCPARGH